MKLNYLHRLTALGLAVGMTAALTACGKGKDEAAASTAETAATSDTAATGEEGEEGGEDWLPEGGRVHQAALIRRDRSTCAR